MPRIEPANRSDRFLSGVADQDGKRPSAVFARGYCNQPSYPSCDLDLSTVPVAVGVWTGNPHR